MMHCSKRMRSLPAAPWTSSTLAPTKRPTPRTTSTLRCLANTLRPPVSFATTEAFQSRSRARSILGSPNAMPRAPISSASSMTLAACNNALDGMQPTFRHTPPSSEWRSMSVTFNPRSAARNAAV